MKIDLSQINQHDTLSIHCKEASADETISTAGPIELTAEAIRTGEDVVVRGEIAVELLCICSRCLKQCVSRITTPLEAHYILPEAQDQQEIDLWEEVRQAIILAEPEKPLCREDCRGICSSCGQDLTEKICGCSQTPRELPLSKLKDFIKEKKSK